MEHYEKELESREIYQGKVLHVFEDVVELENGERATREVVRHQGAVCIAAVTEDDMVYLVRQFRYPMGRELLELPAGKLEKGEEPLAAAMRELGEEAGVLARGLKPCRMALDEDEFLTPLKMPLEQAAAMAEEGALSDGKTCVAVLRLRALRRAGKF